MGSDEEVVTISHENKSSTNITDSTILKIQRTEPSLYSLTLRFNQLSGEEFT